MVFKIRFLLDGNDFIHFVWWFVAAALFSTSLPPSPIRRRGAPSPSSFFRRRAHRQSPHYMSQQYYKGFIHKTRKFMFFSTQNLQIENCKILIDCWGDHQPRRVGTSDLEQVAFDGVVSESSSSFSSNSLWAISQVSSIYLEVQGILHWELSKYLRSCPWSGPS